MAYFRKRNGKWKVEIKHRNFPRLSKTFLDKANARKWARDVENRMDRNIYEADIDMTKKINKIMKKKMFAEGLSEDFTAQKLKEGKYL